MQTEDLPYVRPKLTKAIQLIIGLRKHNLMLSHTLQIIFWNDNYLKKKRYYYFWLIQNQWAQFTNA